jgi:hypothetical protein
VIPLDLTPLLEQYRSGLEAELSLLHHLADVSARQRAHMHAGRFDAFQAAADERDAIMRGLATIADDLRGVRQQLHAHHDTAVAAPAFAAVSALQREAAALVASILDTDQLSLSALADAEVARRSAVASLERGESTLAAYRRVLAPPVSSATLVDRRG